LHQEWAIFYTAPSTDAAGASAVDGEGSGLSTKPLFVPIGLRPVERGGHDRHGLDEDLTMSCVPSSLLNKNPTEPFLKPLKLGKKVPWFHDGVLVRNV
jgi:hypothetical protein